MSYKATLTDKIANDSAQSRLTEESRTTENGLRVITRLRKDADDSVYSETLLRPGESESDKSEYRKMVEEKMQNAIFVSNRKNDENAMRDVDDIFSSNQTSENIDDLKSIWSRVSGYGTDDRYDYRKRQLKWQEYKFKLNTSLADTAGITKGKGSRGKRSRSSRRNAAAPPSEGLSFTASEVETAVKGEIDAIVSTLGKETVLAQVSASEDYTTKDIPSDTLSNSTVTLMSNAELNADSAKEKIDAMIKVYGKEWTESLVSTAKPSTNEQLANTVIGFSKSWNESTARAEKATASLDQPDLSTGRASLELTALA